MFEKKEARLNELAETIGIRIKRIKLQLKQNNLPSEKRLALETSLSQLRGMVSSEVKDVKEEKAK